MSLTLIAHNAYWFQGSPSLWGEERVEAHPEILASLIDMYGDLQPDVLCLQEVPSREISDVIAAALDMRSMFAHGGSRPSYGGAVLWRGFEGAVDDLTQTNVADGRVFERICLVLRAESGGRSFTIANIHLSSNRYAPERRGEPMRVAEVQALFGVCGQPDIVAGDFNAKPDSEVYGAMVERGFADIGSQLFDAGRTPDRRVDYIWVRTEAQLAAEGCAAMAAQRFIYAASDDVSLSDHPPVGALLTL